MTINSFEESEKLNLNCLSYSSKNNMEESFYFSEMATMQAVVHLPTELTISKIEIFVEKHNDYQKTSEEFKFLKTLSDFINYFKSNQEEYIYDLELLLDDGVTLSTHDDGEVELTIKKGSTQIDYIKNILNHNNLPENLISVMRKNANKFLEINPDGNLLNKFENFDTYIEHIMKKSS